MLIHKSLLQDLKSLSFFTLFCSLFLFLPIELKGVDFSALQKKALLLAQRGNLTESIRYFHTMNQIQPYNESARFWLSQALIYQEKKAVSKNYHRDLKRAISLLKKSISLWTRIDPFSQERAIRLFHLGIAYWYLGYPQKARSSFQKSFRADPKMTQAIYNLYSMEEEAGNYTNASLLRQKYLLYQKKFNDRLK